MTRFHVLTASVSPGMHIWRESRSRPNLRLFLKPVDPVHEGWATFEAELDPSNTDKIGFMLFEWNELDHAVNFENEAFRRELPRADGLPAEVWFFQDSSVVSLHDPKLMSQSSVRIHLITANRYRNGLLYIWHKSDRGEEFLPSGVLSSGPYWDLLLTGERQHYFNFKFLGRGEGGERWEADFANRTWTAWDGPVIWVKSETPTIASKEPHKVEVRLHFQPDASLVSPQLDLRQDGSDFAVTLEGSPDEADSEWLIYRYLIYTELIYEAQFHWWDASGQRVYEHSSVRRSIKINVAADLWVFEGESHTLETKPEKNLEVLVSVLNRPADHRFDGPLFAHVWIGRARTPLYQKLPVDESGGVKFLTYPGITTSIKFHTESRWESLDRHARFFSDDTFRKTVYVTLDRFQPLSEKPPVPLYKNPPDWIIQRPGVYEERGQLRFVLYAPKAARVRVWGAWMKQEELVDLVMTEDEQFWWTSIPVQEVKAGLRSEDYHGIEYHYIIDNDRRSQDPAAGWVVHSGFDANSRLVCSSQFAWSEINWRHPTWDHLIIYQLHPRRFSERGGEGFSPLGRVQWELESTLGYLRQLGVTAIQLLPVHEFAGDSSWGYNPAFYYAVESSYGGPDALKNLVDTCHRHGMAVLLDLVLNHSGNDNPLWELSREIFFDGDTKWGALVNFDHPQCRYFFESCVGYLAEEYRVDGFRLDHTRTIMRGDEWQDDIITTRGSGGGWEFLRGIHQTARQKGGEGFIIIGEHLPNEWEISNNGGLMDSQWNDKFHDRLEDAFRYQGSFRELADAFQITHTEAQAWFHSTNYAESHDEVGNENDRIAHVAGFGKGLRAAKVHAAAVLLSRGIPMFFMGAEAAEWRQFTQHGNETLPLDTYLNDPEQQRVRRWWHTMCTLRRESWSFKGAAPLRVRYAQEGMIGFARGDAEEYYVFLNFGSFVGHKQLAELNLAEGVYRELWNSTWDEFWNESEQEQPCSNGGRSAQLHRGSLLNIPPLSAIILERI